jgi:hypothetical protein
MAGPASGCAGMAFRTFEAVLGWQEGPAAFLAICLIA